MDKYQVLKEYFGYTEFRAGQETIIDRILEGRDVVAIMPTGMGKSLCYQVPVLMLEGITLVISPLISLMKDQIGALIAMGIKAAFINSYLSYRQQRLALERASQGAYKIIYVAPERLSSPEFIDFAVNNKIAMVAVDEAHCISQWGQDFRPGYLKIAEFIESMGERPIVSAFTATATSIVRDDIINSLKLDNPYALTTGFDRENLYFEVQKPKNKLNALKGILDRLGGKSGIVYCSTRKNVEEVCRFLNELGHKATRYHAGLSADERTTNQNDFLYDKKNVMVATNAFGMGIDKSNVSYVIHYNMPKDMESYYQEAGRAGRDGSPAECILLYSGQDVMINNLLIGNGKSDNLSEQDREQVIAKAKERLKKITLYCSVTGCLREYILRYFGDKPPEYCGNCGNCNTNFEPHDITLEAQKIISCIGRLAQINRQFGKTVITEILHGSRAEKIRKMKLDRLSTYGIMSDKSRQTIMGTIDYLIEEGFLKLTGPEYPTVIFGERYKEALKEQARIIMMIPKEYKLGRKYSLTRKKDSLFETLRVRRAELAARQRIPAFMVLSDATLLDMCQKLPRSVEEFGNVKGIGAKKQESYGEIFVAEIKKYLAEKGQSGKGEQFSVDSRVFHKSFGPGRVLAINEHFAEIKFDSFPEPKKLNLQICIQKEIMYPIDSHDGDEIKAPSSVALEAVVTEAPRGRAELAYAIRAVSGYKVPAAAITHWLGKEGFLVLGERYRAQEVTPKGHAIGISFQKRTRDNGEEYEQIMLSAEAQKYIVNHFEKLVDAWSRR